MNKVDFLKKDFIPLLQKLDAGTKGKWGVLSAQQMIEHFVDSVMVASGKLVPPVVNVGETLDKYREFMFSDKPFRENTPNPLMDEKGAPLRKPDMAAAIAKLQQELDHFFDVFEKDPKLTTRNSFFGDLDFEGNVHLLYKHAMHHLRQFSLV